jgi:predicted RNA-binding Zn-ribbon protein involved in translation (DUF1610 family)
MNKFYILLLITTLTFFNDQRCFAQSYTTTSKSCGKCGKSVSSNSKIGDKCPHCGVIWGRENSHTTTSTQTYPGYPSNTYKNDYRNQLPTNVKSNIKKQPVKNDEDTDNSTASKSETESWILEKLNANTPKRYYDNVGSIDGFYSITPSSGWYNKNYHYSFDSYNLVVEYEQERNDKTTQYRIKIPIYDIDRAYDYKGDFWITTKKETIIVYNLTENTKSVTGAFTTDFNIYSETELCKRLHKAFLHLKKFYKKPISKEAF